MASFLNAVSSCVTAAISWISSYVGVITADGNEMLLVFLAIPLIGTGIGLIKRMISL